MIRIKDYIFNENEIVKIQFDDGSKEMEIDHKNGNRTFIDGTLDDIEWNYDSQERQYNEETEQLISNLQIKNYKLQQRIKELEKEIKKLKGEENV